MKQSKIQETREIIKDLAAIITACESTVKACTSKQNYDLAVKDLVISYEERENQYRKLLQFELEAVKIII